MVDERTRYDVVMPIYNAFHNEKISSQGREEERLARTLTLARTFRDIGVSLDKIAKATSLSENDITSL